MKILLFSFIFNNLLISFILAQPAIKFNSITTKDGLAGDFVYALHQDKNGFLWIGTHRGLNRYDGYSFRLYAYISSDTNSLSGNHIHCIKEDSNGTLWLATNKGLNSLEIATGKIKRYIVPENMPDYMLDIFPINDSLLLINARTILYCFNKKKSVFTALKISGEERSAYHTGDHAKFTKDDKGNIYIAGGPAATNKNADTTVALLINWQQATASYINLKKLFSISLLSRPVYQLYLDASNNGWAFSPGLPILTEQINRKKINFPYKPSDIYSLGNNFNAFYEEPGERLWMATGHGLILYDYKKYQFYRYIQKPGDNTSITNNRVQTIIRDRNGVYWLGTFGGGLCYFSLQSKFGNIAMDSTYSKDEQTVRGMNMLQSGRIYVNTLSDKKFIVEKDKSIHAETVVDFKNYRLLDSIVYEFTGKTLASFSEKNSALLHSFFNARCGTSCISGQKKHYTMFKNTNDIFRSANLYISSNNNVWIKYASYLYDGTMHSFTSLKQEPTFLSPMNDENFLIASNNGLYIYDTKSNSISATYLHEAGNNYSISSNNLHYLLKDKYDNYWVATADTGFDYWDRKANRFYNYSVKEGLADNTVYMMLPDKHGRLWISTNKGLSCFDTLSKTFTNYDRFDGLINTEFNWGSACVDNEGTMYFGGMDGIDYFHPDSFIQVVKTPPLLISGFKVHDKLQPLANAYNLTTNENTIQIEFTGNDFLNASKTFYRYKLEDADNYWVIRQGINTAIYNKLPYGDYRFIAQASYDNKTWSNPVNINFTIATPWFQSWWFLTTVAICIAAILYYFFNYRLQQQLRILRIRNRIHRDLHDDVGATLSSVKAYSEILSNDPGNTVIAGLIKENAAEMIEQLETITWATSPQHDSFVSLVAKITRYAAPACNAKNIRFQAIENGIAKDHAIPGEIRQTLYLVAKEAINNANKYSGAQDCVLTAEIENNVFKMEITDNGMGFNGNANGTGNGLRNIEERLKEAGGKALITSTAGEGTTVSIYLPYPFKIPDIWDRKKVK